MEEAARQAQMLDLNAFKEWIVLIFGVMISIIGYYIRKAQRDQVRVAIQTEHDQRERDDSQKNMLEEVLARVKATNGDVIALKTWRDAHEKEVGRVLDGINRQFEQLWSKVDKH